MNDGTRRVKHFALAYLKLDCDPIPRFRILRDVLHRDVNDRELRDAKANIHHSKWFKQLASEQKDNGGWSRFHSMNSKAQHKIPTTEYAVSRARILGLNQEDSILSKAQSYCEGLLNGTIPWPDDEGNEPNDRWPAGEEMFVASTLALINPHNSLLLNVMDKWCRIVEAAFATGSYDSDAEWRAHCQLTGATTMRNSYLVLNNRYALTLLGCARPGLKIITERALLDWILHLPRGIGYLGVPLDVKVSEHHPRALRRWFSSHRILSLFGTWHEKIIADIDTLWTMQSSDGFWDFGVKAGLQYFHLSESWRKSKHRLIDQSVHVLLLMDRYYAEG